jgi:hypothetical protein
MGKPRLLTRKYGDIRQVLLEGPRRCRKFKPTPIFRPSRAAAEARTFVFSDRSDHKAGPVFAVCQLSTYCLLYFWC